MGEWTREAIADHNEDAVVYDEFEAAIIGLGYRAGGMIAVVAYDYDKCIDILSNQGMSEEEAIEYFEFNTLGAWVGENTPIFIQTNID